MTSYDTSEHYRAIQAELLPNEYLLWWGRPAQDLRRGDAAIVGLLVLAIGLCVIGLAIAFGRLSPPFVWVLPAGLLIAALLWWRIKDSRRRGLTLYALTNMRAIRACGRSAITAESAWLSHMTNVSVTVWTGFGIIWSSSTRSTWGIRKHNFDHQAIFRGIINPREVYALIITLRPELAGHASGPSYAQWLENVGAWVERNQHTP